MENHRFVPRAPSPLFEPVAGLILISRVSCVYIVKLFPHDPSDLSFLLDRLHSRAAPIPQEEEENDWMVQYILWLWLSLVIQLPFDLKRWDVDKAQSTPDRVMSMALSHMPSPGVDRDAAGIVVGALCSRCTLLSSLLDEGLLRTDHAWYSLVDA